jgi:hypothetical protein
VSTITPLATPALLAVQRACSVHVVTVASHATHTNDGPTLAVVVVVGICLMALIRAIRRVAALVGTFIQLAAAMTSVVFVMLIAALAAIAFLIH